MQRIIFVVIPIFLLLSLPVNADLVIKQTESHSVFKGVFLSVWSKLKAVSPSERQSAKSTVEYTAGLRGAETTETLIQPYWKDDLSQDQVFQTELKDYSQAQHLMNQGDLQASTQAFDSFIQQHEKSELVPNALFAQSLSYAGVCDIQMANAGMNKFIENYPRHPLVVDARQVVIQLQNQC